MSQVHVAEESDWQGEDFLVIRVSPGLVLWEMPLTPLYAGQRADPVPRSLGARDQVILHDSGPKNGPNGVSGPW